MTGYSSLATAKLRQRHDDSRLRLQHAFPLLFLGVAFLLVGAVLFANDWQIRSVHVPIWLLALSIGGVALAGGITAAVAGDFGAPDPFNRTPDRSEAGLRPERSPPAGANVPPTPSPVGDSRTAPIVSTIPAVAEPRMSPPSGATPPPRPAISVSRSPARRPPDPVAGSGETVRLPSADPALDAALSDLERMFQEMTPSRPAPAKSRSPAPAWAESPVPESAPPPSPPTRRVAVVPEPVRAQPPDAIPPAPSAPVPTGVVDEFSRLLSEFYPDIRPGATDPRSRAPLPKGALLGCPGCGRDFTPGSERTRCLRCNRPMCGVCAGEAATAKRALLCRSCFATYGVGAPAA